MIVPLDVPLANAFAVALQPDGKLIIGGKSYDYGVVNIHSTLVRLNSNGSLDTTFGSNGIVITSGNTNDEEIDTLAIQPDGKILAAGYRYATSPNISGIDSTVERFNANGSLDSTFNGDGILIAATANDEDRARSLILEPDGKIFVVGFRAENASKQYEFSILKLNADGTRDNTFSSDGLTSVWVGLDNSAREQINAIVAEPDGKILVGGSANDNFALARYTADGSLDTTFDGDGRILISPMTDINNQGSNSVAALALQSDGKIIAVGSVFNRLTARFCIAIIRLTSDGTPDAGFGDKGKVVTSFQTSIAARAVVIQPDGKIVVAGEDQINTSKTNFLVARYNQNGSLDATFGIAGAGTVETPFGTTVDAANSIALQPDGKIVVAGYSNSSQSGLPQFAAVRYNPTGSIDTSFGDGGKVVNNFANKAYAVAIQPDGKIVISGSGGDFSLLRLNQNGTPDINFGTNGQVKTSVRYSSEARAMTLQGDGKIILAGFSPGSASSGNDFTLIRYNASGSLDPTFDSDGIVITDLGSPKDEAYAVALQSDGRIVAAGKSATRNPYGDFAIVRYISGYTPAISRRTEFDFDGDGKADVSVYRPPNDVWYLLNSTAGFSAAQFGISTDKLVPADFDGDGKTDIAVWREGNWYIQQSTKGFASISFGSSGDIPMPADFDGDGKADLAVYRPSNGTWYVLNLANNAFDAVQFGISTDKPAVADYDGDGKADYAVYRPSNGVWYLLQSIKGFSAVQFGVSTDKPVVGDYDGDGKADEAVYRPETGTWYLFQSTKGFASIQFGLSTDLPAPADYDGDGKTDVAVFR
ncbi:MAG: FG-GAP-like repeat-containing protein, partial [Pyrinomonadaceae bacterium]